MAGRIRLLCGSLLLLAVAGALGVSAGLAAAAFINSVGWLFDRLAGAHHAPWPALLLLPVAGGLLSGLLCRSLPAGRPLGLPELMRTALGGIRHLRLLAGLKSSLASFCALASGGSVGMYSPVIHLGGTLGGHVLNLLPGRRVRTGLACGVSAAVAAAFSAPFAGILFAHEVVLRNFSLRQFAPVATAALCAYWATGPLLGMGSFLDVVPMAPISLGQAVSFVATGLACGLLSWLLMSAVFSVSRQSARLPLPDWLKPAAGGLAAGLIALAGFPEVLGTGLQLLERLVAGEPLSAPQLSMLLIAKAAATVLCIGLGMAGGMFMPALAIGGLFGAVCGVVFQSLAGFAAAPVSVYALVGMFATVAPFLGAPVAAIMIALEFSGSYQLAVAVAVAIVVASFVCTRFARGSYYQLQADAGGLPLGAGPEQVILSGVSVREWLAAHERRGAPGAGVRIAETASLWDAVELAGRHSVERIDVVDTDGRVKGALDPKEVMREHLRLSRRQRDEENEL